jgi:plasmid stabilization system protein ParE
MRLVYHPLVHRDVGGILRHDDRISGRLGDEFWSELMCLLESVSRNPERFHLNDRGLRRANMQRFPYHLLFRRNSDGIRVLVVRHDKRDPAYGVRRR